MGLVKVIITGMTEALMPEKSLSGCFDRKDRSVLLNVFMERKAVEIDREV